MSYDDGSKTLITKLWYDFLNQYTIFQSNILYISIIHEKYRERVDKLYNVKQIGLQNIFKMIFIKYYNRFFIHGFIGTRLLEKKVKLK